MGCNQSGVDEYPIPCKDAERIALLTDFAAAMKAKLDSKDEKYGNNPFTFEALVDHLQDEFVELHDAMSGENFDAKKADDIAGECVDVANMAFLLREKCFELIKEKRQ
jgi:NTP pyrophosphatase (non-canonical NTP hydrolase)